MVGRKKSFISGCGQMILKFQSANMLNALHLGIFKNVGALVSLQPGPAKYFYRTRMSADVLSLSPKMPLLEVDDMLMQDHKTVFVQKSTSQVYWIYLEFGEMANLAALTKRWGKIACSCAMNYFPSLLKHVISSQARQNKYKHRMMWLSAEMYCVWGGCNTRDAKNIWSNSICCIPQWPYLLDSFEWAVYGGLAQHFTPQSTVPMQWTALLIWCCVLCGSAEMAPPNAKIPSANHDDAGIQRSSHEAFASISRKPCKQVDNQSWNKTCAGLEHQSDFVETREIYNYIYIANIWIYTFCILKWMDLRHSLFVLDCQILSVWGPKTLPTQPTRLIREWNNFNMFRIARTLVVSVKFSSSLLDISSWR